MLLFRRFGRLEVLEEPGDRYHLRFCDYFEDADASLALWYSGAWIFDPEGLPEDFQPYHKEEYPRQDNYPGVELTFEEQELLAKLVWAEARGECAEGQQAVAEVVLNRLVSGRFGQSITGVILNPGQFRGAEEMDEAEPWQAQYDAIDAARYGKPIPDKDVFYFATTALTSQVFDTIGGHVFCRDEIVPEETKPEETKPEETQPEETTPEETKPEETTPEETQPEETKPEETTPEETKPEETQPEETTPEETKPEETQPEETQPEETTSQQTEPEAKEQAMDEPIHEIPNLYQSDYPEVPYGDGTITDCGSSMVSLAMASSYMTGYPYTPDHLASWFSASGEDDIARLEAAAETLMLPFSEAETLEEAAEAAQEGKLLILRLENQEDAPTPFTDDVHFILVRGVTEDGKYLVNDPQQENYENEALLDGFETGFSLDDLRSGCTHFWILDPAGLAEDFVPYNQ